MHEGEWSTRLGLAGIPGSAEDVMVARDLLLTEDAGGKYHVAHLSTARSLDLVRWGRSRGFDVTCEEADASGWRLGCCEGIPDDEGVSEANAFQFSFVLQIFAQEQRSSSLLGDRPLHSIPE